MKLNGTIVAGSSVSGELSVAGEINGTIQIGGGSSGPSAEDVFSTEGIDELTIEGNSFTGVNVKKYVFPDLTILPAYSFSNNGNVEEIEAPELLTIEQYALQKTYMLNVFNAPKLKHVLSNAFYESSVKKLSFPDLESVGQSAFAGSNAEEISIPAGITPVASMFSGAKNLKKLNYTCNANGSATYLFYFLGNEVVGESEVNLNVTITSISGMNYMFNRLKAHNLTVSGLSSYSANGNSFQYMDIDNLSFPDLTTGAYSMLSNCKINKSLSMPNVTTFNGNRVFQSVVFGETVDLNFPALTSVRRYDFYSATGARSLTLPACVSMTGDSSSSAKNIPSGVHDLYLPGETVCTLYISPTYMFANTKLLSEADGRIHVPASLETSYKESNNWSSIAEKIVGDL